MSEMSLYKTIDPITNRSIGFYQVALLRSDQTYIVKYVQSGLVAILPTRDG